MKVLTGSPLGSSFRVTKHTARIFFNFTLKADRNILVRFLETKITAKINQIRILVNDGLSKGLKEPMRSIYLSFSMKTYRVRENMMVRVYGKL